MEVLGLFEMNWASPDSLQGLSALLKIYIQ